MHVNTADNTGIYFLPWATKVWQNTKGLSEKGEGTGAWLLKFGMSEERGAMDKPLHRKPGGWRDGPETQWRQWLKLTDAYETDTTHHRK